MEVCLFVHVCAWQAELSGKHGSRKDAQGMGILGNPSKGNVPYASIPQLDS